MTAPECRHSMPWNARKCWPMTYVITFRFISLKLISNVSIHMTNIHNNAFLNMLYHEINVTLQNGLIGR